MIRTTQATPTQPMVHFRQRLELVSRQTRRALEKRRRTLRTGQPVALRHGGAVPDQYLRLRWRGDLAQTRGDFNAFYDQYDALIGVLCLAAQEGVAPRFESDYSRLRVWLAANYPRVQTHLRPHLTHDATDTFATRWGRRPCDAFEALYLPPTIAAMLHADNGTLISRLMRTQDALAAWDTALAHEETAARRYAA